jgi:hypothetical protein
MRTHQLLRAVGLLLLTTGCAHKHYYAPTEQAHTFSELDKSAQGVAPPVAQNVTYERLLNARSEPQNWLTYYGAYTRSATVRWIRSTPAM